MGKLDESVAIVTGAGSAGHGIGNGRASAIRLADEGAMVALLDVTDSSLETKAMIEERGGRCEVLRCDVTDPVSTSRAVEETYDRWGRLDILVNNVGVAGPAGTVIDVDMDAWHRCLDINVTSMVLMSRYAIPKMKASGGGAIVNMSSIAGIRGGHAAIAYSTTKGAVVSLTHAMASQHGADGIRVNAVAPGLVYTPMVAVKGIDDRLRKLRASSNLLGTEGTAWDVAEAVLFLAGSTARWITGVVLPVDAGLSSFAAASQVSITSSGPTVADSVGATS
ncbi:SDR family oxidoreductase [Rhodococcus sp. 14-2483-1-2]|uniref:SDR family NAD(P)-dependent oxidoreductase n=1 Tax=Rhodococcus sp. 14-2483-1-2 TaxID=2023147 RepID=UPI000B9BB78F|nr:SDR family oxidoreductase [Rhodococcus sp. 14-2483-1-2]OZF26118.1 oxidoreductase [Rhodococcus sp. 14-2483-1-2]